MSYVCVPVESDSECHDIHTDDLEPLTGYDVRKACTPR